MPVNLPNLSESPIGRLVVCGAIQTDSQEISKWMETRRNLIASYTKNKLKHYVRLTTDGGKSTHFHVEIAKPHYFGKGKPTITSSKEEIQESLDLMLGTRIKLRLKADFLLNFQDLPENGPIKVLSITTKVGGTEVKLSGGRLSLKGSGVDEIEWSLMDKKILITLKANISDLVSPKYIQDAQLFMQRYFKVLVLGKPHVEA